MYTLIIHRCLHELPLLIALQISLWWPCMMPHTSTYTHARTWVAIFHSILNILLQWVALNQCFFSFFFPILWCSWRWLSHIWLWKKVKVKIFKHSSVLVAAYWNLIQNSADLKKNFWILATTKTQKFIVLPF